MKTTTLLFTLLAALVFAAALNAATVVVTANDPAKFSDVRLSSTNEEDSLEIILDEFRAHLTTLAKRYLTEGQTLEINFTDINLAGEFEHWHSMLYHDIRWVRDIYVPRLEFDFKLTGADGSVISEGSENLTDLAFLWNVRSIDRSITHYEKQILSTWMRGLRNKG